MSIGRVPGPTGERQSFCRRRLAGRVCRRLQIPTTAGDRESRPAASGEMAVAPAVPPASWHGDRSGRTAATEICLRYRIRAYRPS
ncbi:hypothetical protein ACFFSY_08315 [Paenibacillus aurantiacus]|uniref:Uncharacterized protein n=1 Tax=Paenibacillus aurantiacus TaxID=1936118 RepID=A0ABV5KL32_9BACL